MVIAFLLYIVGFVLSLWVMHNFKDELDINHYDPPHEPYYDDYESNATAYLSFSFMWPLYWLMMLVIFLWKLLVRLSESFQK